MSTVCRSSQDLKFHCAVLNAALKYRSVERRQSVQTYYTFYIDDIHQTDETVRLREWLPKPPKFVHIFCCI